MIFQKLFKFRSDDKQPERRLKNRYAVGPSFPLVVSLSAGGGSSRGRVANISAGGLGIVVDQKPAAETAAVAQISFILESFEIKAAATIRYVRPADQGFHCGLTLTFHEPESRFSYLQLLMPIAIGSTLARSESGGSGPHVEPEFDRLTFTGESDSKLTIWCRKDALATPENFEFQVEEYFVRGRALDRSLSVFSLVDDDRPHRAKDTAPLFQTGSGLETEIRQLFRWSALNMQQNIPDRLRGFLRSFLH
ncbi:MAG TPA: PilZ domain-containing protein [Opitutaceae bacterium]|nr:PilZ domain-containing protein [Opitutaceae bacterium]